MFARAPPRIGYNLANREDGAFGACYSSQVQPVRPAEKIDLMARLVGIKIVVRAVREDNLL